MQTHRFSTAWPRVNPDGRGPVNKAGLGFYDRLVDGLLEAGIVPFDTLFHWDMSQALQDQGGRLNRDTVNAFGVYAEVMVKRLGDLVKNWMTHNEIPCFIGIGYGEGRLAPGLSVSREDAEVGLVNNPVIPVPVAQTPGHEEAAQKAFVRIGANLAESFFKGA